MSAGLYVLLVSFFDAPYIRGLVLGRTRKIYSAIFAHPSPKFYSRVKKCEMSPRVSTAVAFEVLCFETEQYIGIAFFLRDVL